MVGDCESEERGSYEARAVMFLESIWRIDAVGAGCQRIEGAVD
jgi:hypothetical protein